MTRPLTSEQLLRLDQFTKLKSLQQAVIDIASALTNLENCNYDEPVSDLAFNTATSMIPMLNFYLARVY
jgi:hypothetical protein